MQDEPAPAEILQAVSRFIRGSDPGRMTKYDLLVAANALDLVARQVGGQAEADAAEHGRLEVLLGTSGSLADLNDALCEAIRAAPYDDLKRFAPHLLRTTLEKLAIDQPNYSAFLAHSAAGDDV